jgi:predicted neutral ceramidase superfamily lipid hydrolase
MTIKNAAFLAFLATLLLSILFLWRLVMDILNVSQNLVPAVTLLSSILYAFAAVTVAIFFFVFQSNQ